MRPIKLNKGDFIIWPMGFNYSEVFYNEGVVGISLTSAFAHLLAGTMADKAIQTKREPDNQSETPHVD